jgi:predicted RNA-binding Zn ribbon-like protein
MRIKQVQNNPALALTNTVDNRPTDHPRELIPTYATLLSWARQSGLLHRAEELRLRKQAEKQRRAAEAARYEVVALRECLFEIFSSVADGRPVSHSVLRKFEKFLRTALRAHRLIQGNKNIQWTLQNADRDLRSIEWSVALNALDLLKSDRIHRVRRCAGAKCDWLFIDTSKRGNRRWCDMSICGNRAKASSYYLRTKQRMKSGKM